MEGYSEVEAVSDDDNVATPICPIHFQKSCGLVVLRFSTYSWFSLQYVLFADWTFLSNTLCASHVNSPRRSMLMGCILTNGLFNGTIQLTHLKTRKGL